MIKEDLVLELDFIIEDESLNICLGNIDQEIVNTYGKLPDYEGQYKITPKVTEIVLPTKDRAMKDDVTIFQIPYAEVANEAGGNTVTIGLE